MELANPSGEPLSKSAGTRGVLKPNTLLSDAPEDKESMNQVSGDEDRAREGPGKTEVPQNAEDLQSAEVPQNAKGLLSGEGLRNAEVPQNEEVAQGYEQNNESADVDEVSDISNRMSSIVISELPMPDTTEFLVPLPLNVTQEGADETLNSNSSPDETAVTLAPLPEILHVTEKMKPFIVEDLIHIGEGVQVTHVGLEAGLTGAMQATYWHLPPGTRTSRPVAQRLGDSITFCISGRGLLWQNGWTFPFEPMDCAGWKGGTGIAHTIINDSNRDGTPGEELVLITAHEIREDEAFFHPLERDIQEADSEYEGKTLWTDPPVQGELGPHPGVPSKPCGLPSQSLPEPQLGYRPSNVVNAISQLDGIGDGELFANATSLSQETGLSGRIGCNLEVLPPGTRSSDPHAHSLEDELVYVMSGNGLVWINGNVQPVQEGDAVGFPAGTGIAHHFINDSNADGTEGEPLALWIIGQYKSKEGDLVYYPLHVEEKSQSKRWWAGSPKYDLGLHNGRPQHTLKQ